MGSGFPLPCDVPFDRGTARAAGLTDRHLHDLEAAGLLRRVLQGVYAAAQSPDSVRDRVRALHLVLPPDTVVTDRTAGWLHGIPILRRGAHLVAPPLDLATTTDTRVRRCGTDGHRRMLSKRDVMDLYGVPVTTPLRTACDLGRLLWRFDALAAVDGALRLGVRREQLMAETGRFQGFRGVRQLRMLVPLADGRAESPGESALRLHWHDAGLPRPELQHEILDDDGWPRFRLDVPAPDVRYAAEYDGVEFHSSRGDRDHDHARRQWIREERNWVIDVFDKDDVYGSSRAIIERLGEGFRRARAAVAVWSP